MGAQYNKKKCARIAQRGPKWLQNVDLKIFWVQYRTLGIEQNSGHCIEISGHCIEIFGYCIELRALYRTLQALYRTPGIVQKSPGFVQNSLLFIEKKIWAKVWGQSLYMPQGKPSGRRNKFHQEYKILRCKVFLTESIYWAPIGLISEKKVFH